MELQTWFDCKINFKELRNRDSTECYELITDTIIGEAFDYEK